MANNVKPTNIVTGKVRLSYAHVWEPASVNGGEAKYSTAILIPKEDAATLGKIEKAVQAAVELGRTGKWGGKVPKNLKLPLRDGDEERPDDEVYAGCMFVNANSNTAPQIVDRALNRILDKSEVYSGCYARVSLSFYAFDVNGNRGVACGLGNIQKVADGEPLSGRSSAEDDFADGYEEDDLLD